MSNSPKNNIEITRMVAESRSMSNSFFCSTSFERLVEIIPHVHFDELIDPETFTQKKVEL
ncbi:hypothetical protein CSA56_11895 [candidate division KSB3 bacterium]|uniref:Uncharacterized protein n=1 Tax=candidate division KSB3 bacterium TaxID=2044937 RepID=A0A2G6KCL0_9BACT|nr:MAG: hypothetical protein CSA56_11895 [candidate division KSB3 bacterium]